MTNRLALSLNAGIAGLAMAIAVGVINPPPIRAQSEPPATPKFEVAAIKLSGGCGDRGGATAGRSIGAGGSSSPERMDLRCQTVMGLIQTAYVQYAAGKRKPPGRQAPISGGPAWTNSERYDIEAKPESPQTQEMMRGPMLQALLEDRFQLRVHAETRVVPVYALTVAKGTPKLQVAQAGKCFSRDADRSVQMSQRAAGLQPCGVFAPSPANDGVFMYNTTLAYFCEQLSVVMDRDVVDKTGIEGVFDIFIETSPRPEDATANGNSLTGQLGSDVLSAIRKMGLKVESAVGSKEFLVIDRVERPSGN